MHHRLSRAQLLYAHRRYGDAETECRKALADAPDDPHALSLLALCLAQLGRRDEALETARTAVASDPELDFTHYTLALVHAEREELQKAKEAVREALRINPEDADYWALLAGIHLDREEFPAALEAADHGLAADPEHTDCMNRRALALTQLGRRAEAAATIKDALQRDPEDAMTHANHGWANLHANRPTDAAVHFREALRLDPELEFARAGMLNALRARNVVFRFMLAYFLWMSRLSNRARWGVIIGGYVAYRALRAAGDLNPALRFWTIPLLVVFALFIFLTWAGPALSNLWLRLDKFGRHVLTREEIRASNVVGALLVLAVLCVAAAVLTDQPVFALAALFSLLLIIPISSTYSAKPRQGRRALAIYTGILLTFALASIVLLPFSNIAGAVAVAAFLIGFFGYTWFANALIMNKPS